MVYNGEYSVPQVRSSKWDGCDLQPSVCEVARVSNGCL